jgi:uncharacterized protein YjbI with pentapeptide repeats
VITRTNFAGANLANASMYDTAAYSMLEPSPSEALNFAGANLSGAHVTARLTGVDMHGADLTRVQMGMRRDQLKTPLWSDLSGCNLGNADHSNADLRRGVVAEGMAFMLQSDNIFKKEKQKCLLRREMSSSAC